MQQALNKKRWAEIILVPAIIGLGMWLRLYRLRETLVFQGDQGRDALIAAGIIRGNLTLLGPVTSVGNMYLGPFYYYFMAPWLWLTYPDPIGPAIGVALVNIGLLAGLYAVSKKWFGKRAAILTLCIYTLMIPAVELSRFSWNPNLVPAGGLLLMWLLHEVWENGRVQLLIWAGLVMGVLTQLHYFTLVLLPLIAMVWLFRWKQEPLKRKTLIKSGALGVLVYALTWLPLIIFNFRHDNLIYDSFTNFIFSREGHLTGQKSLFKSISEIEGRSLHLLSELLIKRDYLTSRLMTYGLLAAFTWWGIKKGRKLTQERGLALAWLVLGLTVLGMAFYQGSIFDHYLGMAMPAAAMVWGFGLSRLTRLGRGWGWLAAAGLILAYTAWVWPKQPGFLPGGSNIVAYRQIAGDIAAVMPEGKYNLALISESKDYRGMNYRYFLATSIKPPAGPDDYRDLDSLVVIDEIGVEDPLEIQVFEIQEPQTRRLINWFTAHTGQAIYLYGR